MKKPSAWMAVLMLIVIMLMASCTQQRPASREETPTVPLTVIGTTTAVLPTVPVVVSPTPMPTPAVTTIATQPTATATSAFGELTGTPAVTATVAPVATPTAEAAEAPSVEGATYTVRWGDTLFSIATMYGTTVDEIKTANGLTSDFIVVGQELIIPGGVVTVPEPAPPTEGGPTVHIVQPGETLFSIAQQYGTTVNAIAQANQITNPWFIYVGQELIIPSGGGDMGPPAGPGTTYVVQPGDTLYSIAVQYGTTVEALTVANNLSSPNFIYVGQRLVIP